MFCQSAVRDFQSQTPAMGICNPPHRHQNV